MTIPGAGGQPPPRPDQVLIAGQPPVVAPGSSQVFVGRLVVIYSGGPASGLFVYDGTPGPGNSPVFSVVAPGVTQDPYGNSVTAILEAGNLAGAHAQLDQFGQLLLFNPSGDLVIAVNPNTGAIQEYSPSYGAGNLVASSAPAAFTDSAGNIGLAGHASYGPGYATTVQAGGILFYTGSLAAGWVFQAQIQVSGAGVLIVTAASALFSDNLEIGSDLTVDGALTVGGSADTGAPTNNSTSTNGLTNGQIAGTSGAQSAGTAHTHGPGTYAVTSGQHNHTLNNHAHPF